MSKPRRLVVSSVLASGILPGPLIAGNKVRDVAQRLSHLLHPTHRAIGSRSTSPTVYKTLPWTLTHLSFVPAHLPNNVNCKLNDAVVALAWHSPETIHLGRRSGICEPVPDHGGPFVRVHFRHSRSSGDVLVSLAYWRAVLRWPARPTRGV